MRVATASLGLLLVTTSAYAQVPPCSSPLGYDPYKPSDIAIMREYGGTVLAQAPISALLKLDPYVPSQGELLRQLGRGIPLWLAYGYPYAPVPAVRDCAPVPEPAPLTSESTPASSPPLTTFSEMMSELERARGTTTAPPAPAAARTAAERTPGVSIIYAGRAWVSSGAAIPFTESEFTRAGESAGFPIYRRAGAKDDLIWVPTTRGMVAPFRMRTQDTRRPRTSR